MLAGQSVREQTQAEQLGEQGHADHLLLGKPVRNPARKWGEDHEGKNQQDGYLYVDVVHTRLAKLNGGHDGQNRLHGVVVESPDGLGEQEGDDRVKRPLTWIRTHSVTVEWWCIWKRITSAIFQLPRQKRIVSMDCHEILTLIPHRFCIGRPGFVDRQTAERPFHLRR